MKQTAVVVAPGRGTYNKTELGYLARHHGDRAAMLADFDAYRKKQGQETLTALDGAARFLGARHTTGENASALIMACAYFDYLSIDRDRFDIIGITGNSMGWYIALTCGGALSPLGGLEVVNTMGTLMHRSLIGGQLIYPFVDADWIPIRGERDRIEARMAEIDARPDHVLALSIDLGGMLVLAGNEAGLRAFEAEMPKVQERFPMRLPNHSGFHTSLQKPVAAEGRKTLPEELFQQPQTPLIDGRGAVWRPYATDLAALWSYTLDHQVVQPYDLTAALRVAAREIMPDVFIVLGPGKTLGGAMAQSLVLNNWHGTGTKAAFQAAQKERPTLLSMGDDAHRGQICG